MKILLPAVLIGCGLSTAINTAFTQDWTPASTLDHTWVAVASSADGHRQVALSLMWSYYVSTNSGKSWVSNSEPQLGSEIGSWNSIAASADAERLVATSPASSIWVSTNGGTSWLSNNVPGVSGWAAITASADGTIFVAADGIYTPGLIYTSTNCGISWTPADAPANHWAAVRASADGTRLLAAAGCFRNGPIYISTNSGISWEQTSAPTNHSWASIASSADGTKVAAVSGAEFIGGRAVYGSIFTSTDAGMSWVYHDIPHAQWQSVASSADGTKLIAVAGFPSGLIRMSTNSGITWTSNNTPDQVLSAVASSADGNQLVVGTYGDTSGNPGPIYTSYSMPTPLIRLTPSGGSLALAWIVPATNFVLQQKSDLATAGWVTLTNRPVLNLTNLQDEITLSPAAGNGFFRLKSQ